MVLESTVVCVDNSEWMRNGDFLPTRIQAQQDAVSIICHAKTRQNPENNVALMTSASCEVLATLTSDVGRILSKLHQIQPTGNPNFLTGIKVAHLALKHRQGKNHKMRIVVFVGSPTTEIADKELVKSAKKLRKEKVNVDVIAMGDDPTSVEKLTQFVDTINGKDGTGSHLVVVPPGPNLSDALRTSAIVQGEEGFAAGGGDFGAGFGDIDPNMDPELALALRVSMEEQRQRQDAESGGKTESTETPAANKPETADPTSEDQMLQNAMAMSMGGSGGGFASAAGMDFNAMSEEDQIALAIQMSMSADSTPVPQTPAPGLNDGPDVEVEEMETDDKEGDGMEEDYSAVMSDPAFLQHLVGSLPGVDPNSEAIQSAVRDLTQRDDEDDDDTKKDNTNEKK